MFYIVYRDLEARHMDDPHRRLTLPTQRPPGLSFSTPSAFGQYPTYPRSTPAYLRLLMPELRFRYPPTVDSVVCSCYTSHTTEVERKESLMADITLYDRGSILVVVCHTQLAIAWVEAHIDEDTDTQPQYPVTVAFPASRLSMTMAQLQQSGVSVEVF